MLMSILQVSMLFRHHMKAEYRRRCLSANGKNPLGIAMLEYPELSCPGQSYQQLDSWKSQSTDADQSPDISTTENERTTLKFHTKSSAIASIYPLSSLLFINIFKQKSTK
ncbi:unnamed protein product [Pieris macdunnoughi]|uniref:Uncharacterized protein n=1 Tax=Pieris macdunnoughi TaxID=345717 RepID=A0A821Q3T5_9NEOP|nr:unnamed protein product [Pieris macdunnoughi]